MAACAGHMGGARMKRRLFGFVCVLSVLMCFLTGVAWAASHAAALLLVYESGQVRYEAMAFRGLLVVRDFRPWGYHRGLYLHVQPLADFHPDTAWYQGVGWCEVDRRGLWGFESVHGKFHYFSLRTWHVLVPFRALSAPLWALALLTGAGPAIWVARRARQLRRMPMARNGGRAA